MVKRSDASEALLLAASVFAFLVLLIFPGALFAWALPSWLGGILALGCALCGPVIMWNVDLACYGPREGSDQ